MKEVILLVKRRGMSIDLKLPVETFVSGTVIQVDFPYRDNKESKVRPAIVLDFDLRTLH